MELESLVDSGNRGLGLGAARYSDHCSLPFSQDPEAMIHLGSKGADWATPIPNPHAEGLHLYFR